MGWDSALRYAKAKFGKTTSAPAATRVDTGLPFGARIGSLLSLQLSPFIRANAAGALVAVPERSEELITSISRLRVGATGSIHRFYVATGDDDGREAFLQVYSEEGAPKDVMYCNRIARFIPETIELQQAFTGESDAGLGVLD